MITTSIPSISEATLDPSSRPRAGVLGRIIGLAAAALLSLGVLSGCSAIKIVYNTAPDFGYWWVDGYLDLNDNQTPRVREELASLHLWHRTTELPKYADILQRASVMATSNLTADQVCAVAEEARTRFLAATDHAEPAVVWLAGTVTPDQLVTLEKKYAKNNKEYRKDWLDATPKERQDRRYKQVLERSEMIYGRLDDAQRQAIRDSVATSVFDPAIQFAERQRRQKDALQTLGKIVHDKPTPAQTQALLRGYFDRILNSPDAAYRKYQDALLHDTCRGFATAHNSTTPAQRDNAQRRLKAYERDLRELAAAKG